MIQPSIFITIHKTNERKESVFFSVYSISHTDRSPAQVKFEQLDMFKYTTVYCQNMNLID